MDMKTKVKIEKNNRPAPISFRASNELLEWIDTEAKKHKISRQKMLNSILESAKKDRNFVVEITKRMPKD